ncbi:MAG: hypothetical protein EXS05_22320 [Planctomycetaceae bacterium]|nr:hypothetical protein [Planctomycetaceae bacterium]
MSLWMRAEMGSEFFKTDVIEILQYLLPGFVATWVFYGLTAHEKATPFERVVEAMIFLVPVQVGVFLSEAFFEVYGLGSWTSNVKFTASFGIAVGIGVLFAYCANHDFPHTLLRNWEWTKRTSFPSEWYSAFHKQTSPFWVVLHLKGDDKKRIYGAAEEFPDQPYTGHFILMHAEWLDANNQSTKLDPVEKILVPAKEVTFVELVKPVDSMPSDGNPAL